MANKNKDKFGPVEIDVISDVMCPWCFIGQKNLENALAATKHIKTDIRWRPFLLDPTIPKQGRDRQEYLNNKFGGKDKAKEIYARVEEAGKAAGINFNFKAIKISPSTIDAHRLLRWAGGVSSEVQNKLAKRLFELYFLEGADIGDHGVLLTASIEVGMDQKIVVDLLAGDADRAEVIEEITKAQKMGVTGVPCFIIGNKYAVMGAQPAETLAQAIAGFDAERHEEAAYAGG